MRLLVRLALTALALGSSVACGHSDAGGGESGGRSGAAGAASGGTSASGGAGGTAPVGGAAGAAAGGSSGSGGAGSGGAAGAGGTGLAGSGGGYTPDPIPSIDSEPPAACPAAQTGSYFQFLDDVCNVKEQPSWVDRDFTCPVVDASPTVQLTGGGTATYQTATAPIDVDAAALANVVPSDLDVAVILIKRVGSVPHFRYLSNGSHGDVVQPWSTTKFLAAANAAANLRIQSSYAVGLTAGVSGIALGDLVTSLCNYDASPYSSNSLGRYFHDIGGRKRANDLIHGAWLNRPSGETFGGNYGEASPALGYTFVEPGGASVSMTPDSATGYSNALSMLTLAEALKRLVLHRELDSQRLPGLQWKDVRVLLYGAEGSAKYGEWGGMSADTAVYLQSSHDWSYLKKRSNGRVRIFSKLGLGSNGQFLNVGYACLPVLDPNDQPVPGLGRELVIATHLPSGGASWRERDRLLARYYREIVSRVVDGRL